MVSLLTLLVSPALAADAVPAPPPPPDKTDFKVAGTYAIWGLAQKNFLLGADHPLDDASYVVQMLRVAPRFERPRYGVVARMDLAQGWWGVDNDPNIESVEDGDGVSSTVYNPYALFRDKDTNYEIHVDHAWGWVLLPGLPIDIKLSGGRMWMGVGNKLVLDQDLDGVKIEVMPSERFRGTLLGAKISEGSGSTKAPTGALMGDEGSVGDANLGGAQVVATLDAATVELFGLYWRMTITPPHQRQLLLPT